jgi:hypothetical protein
LEQIGYQIVHSIAGRIRIRVPWLETDAEAASKYQRLLEALSYVNSVRTNSLAQSMVILYNAKTLTIAEAEELVIAAMQQVKLTPPMEAPTIETEPAEQSSPLITTPPSSPTKPASKPNSAPPEFPNSKQSAIPEIPSPWDESEDSIAPINSELFDEVEEVEEVEADQAKQTLSTSLLAKRLRVTSQAITQRRTKTDFQTWTQAQDPDRIAWRYDAATRAFYPVNLPKSIETTEIIDENLGQENGADSGKPTVNHDKTAQQQLTTQKPDSRKQKSSKSTTKPRSTSKKRK